MSRKSPGYLFILSSQKIPNCPKTIPKIIGYKLILPNSYVKENEHLLNRSKACGLLVGKSACFAFEATVKIRKEDHLQKIRAEVAGDCQITLELASSLALSVAKLFLYCTF